MGDVINYEFLNILDQKIEKINTSMLEAIVATQSNQYFFHKIVNRASHIFMHRQSNDKLRWNDLIKVYVGVPLRDEFIANISENDRLDKGIVAVPFGLLLDVEEISGIIIPLSVPFDLAAPDDDKYQRGLMYKWIHTNTEEFMKELLFAYNSTLGRAPDAPIQVIDQNDFIDNVKSHTAFLCEFAISRIKEKQNDALRHTLLMSALSLTLIFSENEDDVALASGDFEKQEGADIIAGEFQDMDLLDLYELIKDFENEFSFFSGFDDFIHYCQEKLKDEEFLKEQELYVRLFRIFCNTTTNVLN